MANWEITKNGNLKVKTNGNNIDISLKEFVELLSDQKKKAVDAVVKNINQKLNKDRDNHSNQRFGIIKKEFEDGLKSGLTETWLNMVNWLFGAFGFSKEQMNQLKELSIEYDRQQQEQ